MQEERKAKASVPTPHIAALPGEIAETVLLPGDPLRAKRIAETFLEEVHCFNEVRNMLGFTGLYRGKRVSVMGTGMGCPSMGIYAHELIHFYATDSNRHGRCHAGKHSCARSGSRRGRFDQFKLFGTF